MYSDINNVALKVATRSDLGLVERLEPRTNCKEQQLHAPKVCSLYLHAMAMFLTIQVNEV